jgi:hypothetical protein
MHYEKPSERRRIKHVKAVNRCRKHEAKFAQARRPHESGGAFCCPGDNEMVEGTNWVLAQVAPSRASPKFNAGGKLGCSGLDCPCALSEESAIFFACTACLSTKLISSSPCTQPSIPRPTK